MGWDKAQIKDLPLSKHGLLTLVATRLSNPDLSHSEFIKLTDFYLRLTDPNRGLRLPTNKRLGRPAGSKNKPKPVKEVLKQSIHDIVMELEAQNEQRHPIGQDEVEGQVQSREVSRQD